MKFQIGGTRIVFIFDEIVVKIPLFVTFKTFIIGSASNYREKYLYDTNVLCDGIRLAKVKLLLFGIILVQERGYFEGDLIKTISTDDFTKYCNLYFVDSKELNNNNIAKDKNGNLIVIDYGFTLPAHDRGKIYTWFKKVRTKINQL